MGDTRRKLGGAEDQNKGMEQLTVDGDLRHSAEDTRGISGKNLPRLGQTLLRYRRACPNPLRDDQVNTVLCTATLEGGQRDGSTVKDSTAISGV